MSPAPSLTPHREAWRSRHHLQDLSSSRPMGSKSDPLAWRRNPHQSVGQSQDDDGQEVDTLRNNRASLPIRRSIVRTSLPVRHDRASKLWKTCLNLRGRSLFLFPVGDWPVSTCGCRQALGSHEPRHGISMERGAARACGDRRRRTVDAIREEETLALLSGGGIGLQNHVTFTLRRDLLDDVILLSEDEIAEGIAPCRAQRERNRRGRWRSRRTCPPSSANKGEPAYPVQPPSSLSSGNIATEDTQKIVAGPP